jgi:hypothetical protein
MVECTHEAGSLRGEKDLSIPLFLLDIPVSSLIPFSPLYCSPPLLNSCGCATLSCALHAWCVILSPPVSSPLAGPAQYSPTLIQSLRHHRPPSSPCSHDPHLLTHDTILHHWATQAVHVLVTKPSSVASSTLSFWLSLAQCSCEMADIMVHPLLMATTMSDSHSGRSSTTHGN